MAPGPIWTPLQLDHGQPIEELPEFGQHSLLERAGQPAELAPVYVSWRPMMQVMLRLKFMA